MHEFHIIDLALLELETGHRVSGYFDVFSDDSDSNMSVDSDDSDLTTSDTDETPVLLEENQTDDARI